MDEPHSTLAFKIARDFVRNELDAAQLEVENATTEGTTTPSDRDPAVLRRDMLAKVLQKLSANLGPDQQQ